LSSLSSFGLSRPRVLGTRYIKTTVAFDTSTAKKLFLSILILPDAPENKTPSFDIHTRRGSISTPTPLAPNSLAATTSAVPSPDPRSYTTSFFPTFASLHWIRAMRFEVRHHGDQGLSGGQIMERRLTNKPSISSIKS